MTNSEATVQVHQHGAVSTATLSRPDVRNAFNERTVAELTAWAAEVGRGFERGEVRVAVLAGAGTTFCAGAEIGWMARMRTYSFEDNVRDAEAMAAMFEALDTLPVPLIGRIQGAALGGGAGLCAVCDVVVAEEGAMFGFTEVRLGIVPAVIAPYAVAKLGVSAARELFLTGARFDAARARALGLVHAVVPATQLDTTVERYVHDALLGAPSAIALTKSLVRQVAGRTPADVRELTTRTIAEQRVSPDGREGLDAFLAKRKPAWTK
ncbi:MAG TPA: enoyl-CoA hydratase-related protein [Vicinamibacterales bacterium]